VACGSRADMIKLLPLKVVAFITLIGADPADSDEIRLRKTLGLLCTSLGSLLSFILGGMYLVFGAWAASALWWGYGIYLVLGTGLFHRRWLTYQRWAYWSIPPILVVPFASSFLLGGISQSSGVYIWALLGPLLNLMLLDTRYIVWWTVAYLALLGLSVRVTAAPAVMFPEGLKSFLLIWNVGGLSLFVIVALYYFVQQRALFQRRAETLLLNIFPRDIAAILQREERVIADLFDEASVLFADVVNFTTLSATLTPGSLVALLNEVFSQFDALTEQYGLEKIKTIGDCYMVASGVPRPRADHASALVKLALDMQTYVARHTFQGQTLALRIGIHSGPVVAGVIGRKKFTYDLWGDAVNIASRMEAHGMARAIQITRATYELIQTEFECIPQGAIHVKGKGEMEVWHVVGKRNKTQ